MLDDLHKPLEIAEFMNSVICVTTKHLCALIAKKYQEVHEEVEWIMRGKILEYEAKAIRNEAKK